MITNYWNSLNERERWLAGIGSFFALFYLFYLLIYSPITSAVSAQSKKLAEQEETLAWMEQVRQQPKKQNTAQSINNAKLLAFIGNQLSDKAFREFPYQLQQTGSGDIQLSFDRVPYKQLLSWLWALHNDYQIKLKQFNAERLDTPGMIKLLVVISAK